MKNINEAEIIESKALAIQEPNNMEKPLQDTQFAQKAAEFLVDIIKQNKWSRKLGGQSEHIQYEGWQTAGKFYGHTVKTHDAEYVELGGTWGFKAKATVVNENTGIEIGSAEAYCMSDEGNWKSKPKFQLASMAQTRAGSKALRQNLGFVVALAGYSPTPAEEMTGDEFKTATVQPSRATSSNGACPSCYAPAGKPHATTCANAVAPKEDEDGILHVPTNALLCEVCDKPAVEKKGTSKVGKPYHAIFCSTDNKAHTKWINNAVQAQNEATSEYPYEETIH